MTMMKKQSCFPCCTPESSNVKARGQLTTTFGLQLKRSKVRNRFGASFYNNPNFAAQKKQCQKKIIGAFTIQQYQMFMYHHFHDFA